MSDEPLSKLLKRKRGNLRKKEMANLLNISMRTYEAYEWGIRTPSPLALAELMRRLNEL